MNGERPPEKSSYLIKEEPAATRVFMRNLRIGWLACFPLSSASSPPPLSPPIFIFFVLSPRPLPLLLLPFEVSSPNVIFRQLPQAVSEINNGPAEGSAGAPYQFSSSSPFIIIIIYPVIILVLPLIIHLICSPSVLRSGFSL